MNRLKPLTLIGLISSTCVLACDDTDSGASDSSTTGITSQMTSSFTSNGTTGTDSTGSSSVASVVEIRLIDDVDEARGYCLDISGGKGEGASIDKGLQAHTCYDYTGELLVDQSFDVAAMANGEFKIPHFNVCMTASANQAGATLQLSACEKKETQLFTLGSDGKLFLQANNSLCVTVSSTEKREGKGGTPKHVMRPISLQPCSDANKSYQAWKTFSIN